MIYAKLQVASLTGEAGTPFPKQDSTNADNPSRLSGRLSILHDSIKEGAFDTVQLCFRGVIVACIGQTRGLEDIITLTDIKTPADFRPNHTSGQEDSRQGRHLDFFFQLPTHASTVVGSLQALPLSSTIRGTTSVTQHTAVNDRQVIEGDCEVCYWVEAQFRRAGRQVGFLHQAVRISALYPHLRVALSNGLPVTIRAKPDLLARCKVQKNPDLSVSMYEPDILIERNPQSGKRQITIPLAVAMEANTPAPGTVPLDVRQSFKCSVEAKWEVHDRFSTVPVRTKNDRPAIWEAVYKTSTASTYKSSILFRPLPVYENPDNSKAQTTKQGSYVATSQLELSVPDAVTQPSLRWDHLARTYTLELSLNFHGIRGAPKYKVRSNIPLAVSTSEDRTEGQKDDVLVDVTETDGLDDDEIALGQPDVMRGQSQSTRLVTRTPPPPYFR